MAVELAVLAVFGAGAWFWVDGLAAREQALRAGTRACRELDAQLLDQTVALARLGLARNYAGRLVLRRTYGFEYSLNGVERRAGIVVLVGRQVEAVQMDGPDGRILTFSDLPRGGPARRI